MLDKGVFSINEVREKEDMDPVEGGDVHLIPLNMTTLENAGKEPTQTQRPLLPLKKKPKKEEEEEEELEDVITLRRITR